jgi:tetratricopeptide (TPR) repeat protein
MLPGKPTGPRLPSFNTSWGITVDTLKESPFLGSGPGNYLTSFNRFRPLEYNQTDLWNLRFTSARNFYLTLVTEVGLLGTLGLVILLIALYRHFSDKLNPNSFLTDEKGASLALIVLLVPLAAFSAGTTLIALLFILLALNSDARDINLDFAGQAADKSAARLPAMIVSLPIILLLVAFSWYGVRALRAEAKFMDSIEALAENNGTLTYDLLREAIQLNPYVDRYRANYAQVNLALAQNVAQKEEITDQDRQTIAQLIQQAIREAKAVVTLNPQRAGNWQLLANTYRSIIAFAEGADTFALQSYNQAITLDPINANLRISLGGLFYALGNYDQAIRAFELAVVAKPDLANSHYNLAAALREKGDIEAAIEQMTVVLSLVDPESEDYQIALAELENLENRQTAGELEGSENLQPPQGPEEPALEPPLELPEDSNPPGGVEEVEATPTP